MLSGFCNDEVMAELPIVIEVEGEQVVGMLHAPRGEGAFPAVLFLHGFTGTKVEGRRLFVRLARRLAACGIASLRIDFRGSGDSAGDASEMTVSSERADALAALRFLAERDDVDSDRIAILGMSLGGMIAAYTLAAMPTVKTAVLWNPVAFPKELIDRRMTPETEATLASNGVLDDGGWPIGKSFIEEMKTADPLAAVRDVRIPTLIVGSTEDEIVPHAHAEAYSEVLRKNTPESHLHRIIGSGHTFASLPWAEEVMTVTSDWLETRLK